MDTNVTINDTYIDWLDKKQATQIFFGGSSKVININICSTKGKTI